MKTQKSGNIISKEDFKLLKDYVFQGNRIADLAGIKNEELDVLFHNARVYYSAGKFLPAAEICTCLFLMNHINPEYFELFGVCMVRLKQYNNAKFAFNQAMFIDFKNPVYHFYLAQILEIQKGLKEAKPAYNKALEICGHVTDKNASVIRKKILARLRGGNAHSQQDSSK